MKFVIFINFLMNSCVINIKKIISSFKVVASQNGLDFKNYFWKMVTGIIKKNKRGENQDFSKKIIIIHINTIFFRHIIQSFVCIFYFLS